MKGHVLIQRPGLPQGIRAVVNRLEKCADEEIVQAYNEHCQLGFTGVYAQAVYVLGLHQQLHARFGSSPLSIKDSGLLMMKSCVKWERGVESISV